MYSEMLHFLPSKYDDWKRVVRYRVTNNLITSQVAGMVLDGMWDTKDDYPLLGQVSPQSATKDATGTEILTIVQAAGIDSLEPQYSCPAGSDIFSSIQSDSNSQWQEHLEQAADLYSTLDDISGVPSDDEGFHMSFDHYYDNLSARQCHDKPLPCKLVNGKNSTTCVTQELADAVYRMGHWEYSQIYRDNKHSLAASVATFGVWVGELAAHLRDAMEGNGKVKYYHNVAHDGSTSRLLSILQIDEMVWPGMGSEIVFELYKKKSYGHGRGSSGKDEYFVRVLFGGKVLKSSNPTLGKMNLVPVAKLLGYFDGLVGQKASKILGKCNA